MKVNHQCRNCNHEEVCKYKEEYNDCVDKLSESPFGCENSECALSLIVNCQYFSPFFETHRGPDSILGTPPTSDSASTNSQKSFAPTYVTLSGSALVEKK